MSRLRRRFAHVLASVAAGSHLVSSLAQAMEGSMFYGVTGTIAACSFFTVTQLLIGAHRREARLSESVQLSMLLHHARRGGDDPPDEEAC